MWSILIVRIRTNASPVYLVLFISATYFLNRPCVYCSLLLAILVVALFDFNTPWFELPLTTETTEVAMNGTMPFSQTASIVASAANNTAQTLMKATLDGLREKTSSFPQVSGSSSYEWVKGLLGKKEWRIPHLDVLVRI